MQILSVNKFRNLSLVLLVYCLIIILWGAWVRISGSGDGCGPHWPLCHGQVLISQELTETAKTLIEYLHRVKSGLFGILTIGLYVLSLRTFPKRHYLRFAALMTLIFTFIEALLGAKLVLFGLVGNDDSAHRAITMGLHLLNTFALLYFLSACCFSEKENSSVNKINRTILFIMFSFCLIACSGGLAALSSTLFPSQSVIEGIKADFSNTSHWLIRYRIFHPLLALSFGVLIIVLLQNLKIKFQNLSKDLLILQAIVTVNLVLGSLNLFIGHASWMKLSHLLFADFAWIAAVRLRFKI